MIGYASTCFSYEPDGQFNFAPIVRIAGMRFKNLLEIDFCQKQVSGFHFDPSGMKIKDPPK